jgi:excisionase family DNA binding protein
MKPLSEDRLLTMREAVRRLRMTRKRILQLVKVGKIISFRCGRRMLIDPDTNAIGLRKYFEKEKA